MRNVAMGQSVTYLWRADVLPCSLDTTGLESALGIDSLIPGFLNPLLYLKYGRDSIVQVFVAHGVGMDNV